MLISEPNVVWLLVAVLVSILFVTITLAFVFLVKYFRAHVVFESSTEGRWHNSAGSSSDRLVIWVARLSSNSKNRENPLFNNHKKSFLLEHICETINNKQAMFAFLENRRKNIERGRVTMWCRSSDPNVAKVWDFEFL